MAGQDNGQGARRRAQMIAQNTMIGREQGPELFYSQDLTLGGLTGGATTIQIPRTLTLNRPLKSIHLVIKGRLVVGTADYTSVSPEHFTNILQQIQLTGIHRIYGNLVPIRLSGATAFQWQQLFGSRWGSSLFINNIRANSPSSPFTFNSTAAASALSFSGVQGTYDFEVYYEVPLGPLFPPSAGGPQRSVSFDYLPQDWADSLQLQLNIGDRTSLGVPAGGTTTTFTSFGSASGSPTLEVHLNYEILGAFGNNLKTGVVIRTEQTFSSFTALVNQTRLSLLQKQITSNIVVKTGLTQASAAPPVFASLSDVQLGRTQIMVDNKPIRNNQNNAISKAYGQKQFDTVWPQGYQVYSFVGSQNPLTAYRGDGLQGGSTFEIDTDILTASASNLQTMVQEMIYGGPFPALKPGA
jgi:hypothetical protein